MLWLTFTRPELNCLNAMRKTQSKSLLKIRSSLTMTATRSSMARRFWSISIHLHCHWDCLGRRGPIKASLRFREFLDVKPRISIWTIFEMGPLSSRNKKIIRNELIYAESFWSKERTTKIKPNDSCIFDSHYFLNKFWFRDLHDLN